MADTTVTKLPALVVEGDASPATSEVTITAPMIPDAGVGWHQITITVTVGTIKFSVGSAALTGDPPFVVTSVLKLTVSKDNPLHFLAAAQNNAFRIEY